MRKRKSFANDDPPKILKIEFSTGKRHLVNNMPLRRSPTTYLESLYPQMVIVWKSNRRLTIDVDLEIFRLVIYNLHRIQKEGKYCASFHSDISENCEIGKGLILCTLGSKSDESLSFKPNLNIYMPMSHNHYQVCELAKGAHVAKAILFMTISSYGIWIERTLGFNMRGG